MDAATPEALKELKRIFSFELKTKDYGLRIAPNYNQDDWCITVYSDSDWAGNKENRHSITGFIIFFLGVPILWRSRAQKALALSSAEAEYYAMSEAAKEIRVIVQLLESMSVEVKKPIVVYVDNIGAIFMSENASATSRTRHIDAQYHFVREFIEEGFLKIVFVNSIENKSDMFTKNVSSNIYESHVQDYVMERGDIAGIAFGVSEEGCWRLPEECGNKVDSPVVPIGSSETPIRLPSTSTSNMSAPTSTIVVSTIIGFVGPGGRLMQDAEHWCLGCLYDTVSRIECRCYSSGSRDNLTWSLSNGSES